MPVMLLFIFGYAITVDVDRLTTVVYDRDKSNLSRQIVRGLEASRYFTVVGYVDDSRLIDKALDQGSARVAISIPEDFSRYALTGGQARIQVIVDGSDSNTATIALGYLTPRWNWRRGVPASVPSSPHRRSPAHLVQPELNPAISSTGTYRSQHDHRCRAAHVADHRQGMGAGYPGTDHLDACQTGGADHRQDDPLFRHRDHRHDPVHHHRRRALRRSPQGKSPPSSLHIVPFPFRRFEPRHPHIHSNESQLAASQAAVISSYLPALLLSGFMFSILNMPVPLQAITYLIPARYFVAAIKGIFLKGNTADMLLTEMGLLALFGLIVFTVAVKKFKKRVT